MRALIAGSGGACGFDTAAGDGCGDAVPGRRGALAAVLKAEPLLKRGILELLALDYECFGYEMPTIKG